MSRSEYKKKKSFAKTPEPARNKPRRGRSQKNELIFVVKKHHAPKEEPYVKKKDKPEEKPQVKRVPPPDDDKDYDELTVELLSRLKTKKRVAMPQHIQPMLANTRNEPFDKPEWIYEVKWDGHRALAYLNKGKAELRSRDNESFNEKFYPVHAALKEWPVKAIVDGEIVRVDENGISAFTKLEEWKGVEDGQLEYYLFDILWLNGIDLTNLPLIERRQILEQLIPDNEIIRFSESFAANGKEFFNSAEQLGIEGIVAKRADSTYQPGKRTNDWLKITSKQKTKPAKKAPAKAPKKTAAKGPKKAAAKSESKPATKTAPKKAKTAKPRRASSGKFGE